MKSKIILLGLTAAVLSTAACFGEMITGSRTLTKFIKEMYADDQEIAVTPVVSYAGTNVTVANSLYRLSGANWLLVSNASNASVAGRLAIARGTNPVYAGMLLEGNVVNTNWSFTAGDIIYADAVAGTVTKTYPTGLVARIVGYATDSNSMWFAPGPNYNSPGNALTNVGVATEVDVLDSIYPANGTAVTNATAEGENDLAAPTVTVTPQAPATVTPTITVTLYTTTMYDSTGAACSNSLGETLLVVTGVTAASSALPDFITNATAAIAESFATNAVVAVTVTPQTGSFVQTITSNVVTAAKTLELQSGSFVKP